MVRLRVFLIIGMLCASSLPAFSQKREVLIKTFPEKQKVDVLIGGKLFTSYLFSDSLRKPVLYPLRAADGTVVTRGFPINPQPGEAKDHPHQVGCWFTYEDVNGLDFWNNSYAVPKEKLPHYGWIRQKKILNTQNGKTGLLQVVADWENQQGKVLLKEKTTFQFSGNGYQRIIDRKTTLTAKVPVTFHDIKDGLLGIRVAKGLTAPQGSYLSSKGNKGKEVWGTRARWCSLYSKMNGGKISITIFDHPQNPGYPTYWHARGYGLFAANPLGAKIFSDGAETMNLHLDKGDSVTFKYRILIQNEKQPSVNELNKEANYFAEK